MIFQLIFNFIYLLISKLVSFLPSAETLPWGIDAVFVQLIGWVNSIKTYVWPLEFPLQMFFYYLLFLLGMMILRLILGSRLPGAK